MIPKLRFTGFTEAWKKTTLGELAVFHDSDRVPLESSVRKKRKGIYPYYGASGIIDYVDDFLFNGEYILFAEDGANIINRSTPIAFLADGKFWVNNHAHIFKATIKQSFVVHLLENQRYDKYNTGTAQPKLNRKVCESISLCLPQSDLEIDRISSLLDCIDLKINLLTKKKKALETYKKGLMQKIFSQELRFKREDGTDYPEWKNLSLKDGVSDFVVPMRDKPKEFNGEVDWCRIEDIENGFINGSIAALRVSNEVISSMNLKVLSIGSVIVSCSAYLGVCARVTKPLITNQTFIGLVPNDRVTTDFLYHLLTTKERILNRLSSGTTISYLSRSEFERLNIELPCLEEQKKISSTLNVADNSIISVESQIRTTQKLKKGLLQQMFV